MRRPTARRLVFRPCEKVYFAGSRCHRRRSGPRLDGPLVYPAEDRSENLSRYRHLGHLECYVARVTNHSCPGLDQLHQQRGQRCINRSRSAIRADIAKEKQRLKVNLGNPEAIGT